MIPESMDIAQWIATECGNPALMPKTDQDKAKAVTIWKYPDLQYDDGTLRLGFANPLLNFFPEKVVAEKYIDAFAKSVYGTHLPFLTKEIVYNQDFEFETMPRG